MIGGIKEESILQAVEIAVDMEPCETEVPDYADDNVSMKVIKIINSYTRIIDDKVWRK